jgi:energy-coupling factor transport system permease protein
MSAWKLIQKHFTSSSGSGWFITGNKMASTGLYRPGKSIIHQVNPLTKLVLATSFSIAGFIAPNLFVPLALFLLCVVLLFVAKAAVEVAKTIFKFVLVFMIVLFVVQSLWWSGGESPIYMLGPIPIHVQGFLYSCQVASRLLTVLCSFYLMMFTTHPSDLVFSLEQRGLPPKIAYVMLATLQSIVEMQERANVIMEVQKCRGVETTGNLLVRSKAYFPLVGPLIIGSVLNIESRALALEVRGFSSETPKTYLKIYTEMSWEPRLRYLLIALPAAVLIARLIWPAQ